MMMFVVRLKRPSEDIDDKAFASKRAALTRFRAAQGEMIDGDVEQCALFEIKIGDAGRAIEMINQGHGTLLESNLEDPRDHLPVRRSQAAIARRSKIKTERFR